MPNIFGATPNYIVQVDDPNKPMLIKDIGPWDQHPSVTNNYMIFINNVEDVIKELTGRINGRRLFYKDIFFIIGMDEIKLKNGKFDKFGTLRATDRALVA